MNTKTLLFVGAIMAIAWMSMAFLPSASLDIRSGQDYALFFAVDDYENMDDLQNPIRNANELAVELRDNFGFQTEIVENPTMDEIDDKLDEYARKFNNGTFQQQGQLFVYFTGHGVSVGNNGYFMTRNADPARPQRTAMEYDFYRNKIDGLACQHIMVAVDACHSATFDPLFGTRSNRRYGRPGEQTFDRTLANHESYRSRVFWTSDGDGNETPDRSTFARQLLEGLRGHQSNTDYLRSKELYTLYLEQAAPRPGGGAFGSDEANSCFLFFKKASINIGDARADRTAYQTAIATNTLPAYRQYLRDYPTGDFRGVVQQKVTSLEAEEQELLAWARAKQQNTQLGYETFIREYPSSIYVAVAENNLIAPSPALPREGGSPDDFIRIPGGTFQMGDTFGEGGNDEKPVHQVEVSTFYMSKYELTVAEFAAFVTATNYQTDAEKGDGSYIWRDSKWQQIAGINWRHDHLGKERSKNDYNHPVIHVSWCNAVAYANWLSERNGLQPVYSGNCDNISANWTANGYRLPAEAEWEYAAREGGKKVRFGNGEDIIRSGEANFNASSDHKQSFSEVGTYRSNTIVVGSLNHPNALGLHDMSGNVWEWCWDWYGSDYYKNSPSSNPKGPESGVDRVLRGGSWSSTPQGRRAAARYYDTPTSRYYDVGFRLARGS